MDTEKELSQTEHNEAQVSDGFAAGSPNRMRVGAIRFAKWLFGPPHLSPALIWLLSALIIGNITLDLLPQPRSYWIDPSTSTYFSFFGTPFRWGVWNIVLLTGYAVITALILNLINIKPAFVLWIGLSLYHLGVIPESFRCVAPFYLPFESSINCSAVHTIVIVLAGIFGGFIVWVATQMGLVSIFQSEQQVSPTNFGWLNNIKRISIGWISLSILAVGVTVLFLPKPTWRLIQPAHLPSGRTEAALSYDLDRSVAVLFGGTSSWSQNEGWNSINDTWEWNGQDWQQMHPQHSPPARYAASMAFDEKRGITVLFGGLKPDPTGQTTVYDDTWEWDGTDWHEVVAPNRPPVRQDAVMFFDPTRDTTVIYGGYYFDLKTQTNVFFDDAWAWNGKNWQELDFTERRRISSSAIVYDPVRQLPLLMDAEGLWSWQAAGWVPLGFADNPPGRWNSWMVFNPESRQIVMFGGFKDKDVFNDTWLLNNDGWEQLITKTIPPRRNGHTMFYDPNRGTVVLFGGLDGGTFYADMWELVQP